MKFSIIDGNSKDLCHEIWLLIRPGYVWLLIRTGHRNHRESFNGLDTKSAGLARCRLTCQKKKCLPKKCLSKKKRFTNHNTYLIGHEKICPNSQEKIYANTKKIDVSPKKIWPDSRNFAEDIKAISRSRKICKTL